MKELNGFPLTAACLLIWMVACASGQSKDTSNLDTSFSPKGEESSGEGNVNKLKTLSSYQTTEKDVSDRTTKNGTTIMVAEDKSPAETSKQDPAAGQATGQQVSTKAQSRRKRFFTSSRPRGKKRGPHGDWVLDLETSAGRRLLKSYQSFCRRCRETCHNPKVRTRRNWNKEYYCELKCKKRCREIRMAYSLPKDKSAEATGEESAAAIACKKVHHKCYHSIRGPWTQCWNKCAAGKSGVELGSYRPCDHDCFQETYTGCMSKNPECPIPPNFSYDVCPDYAKVLSECRDMREKEAEACKKKEAEQGRDCRFGSECQKRCGLAGKPEYDQCVYQTPMCYHYRYLFE